MTNGMKVKTKTGVVSFNSSWLAGVHSEVKGNEVIKMGKKLKKDTSTKIFKFEQFGIQHWLKLYFFEMNYNNLIESYLIGSTRYNMLLLFYARWFQASPHYLLV
jgi:hypothetical protein